MADPPPTPSLPPEMPDIETSSEGYARRFSGQVGAWFLATQLQIALEMLEPWAAGAAVLDVGGGHAQLAGPLADCGFRVTVTGSDPVCRQRLGRSIPFEVCALPGLPFADRSFDVVIAFRLIAHMERWRELVAEMCRVARHAVILDYSDTRSFNLLYGPLFHWKRRLEGNTRTFLCFRPGEVAAECARHGFGRPLTRRQFFLPMVVHRKLRRAGLSRAVEGASAALGLTRALGSPVVLRTVREGEENR
jgi:SAM-dependent methyltransferase